MRNCKKHISSILIIISSFSSISQVYDTLKDPRDGHKYLTVNICNKVWMAENLNFKTKKGSVCYGDDKKKCNTYGRLYNWYAVSTACPAGWHASTLNEWRDLLQCLGPADSIAAHMKLKSTLWRNQTKTDDNNTGFSAIPSGYRDADNVYHSLGYYAYFWMPNDAGELAWCVYMSCNKPDIQFPNYLMETSMSVRCIKD